MEKKTQERDDAGPSRRRFTKAVAAAIVASPLACAATSSNAQTPPTTTREATAPPNPQPTPSPAPTPQPPPSPVALAYAEVARARFGERLSAEEFERVKRDLEGNVRAAERLAAFKLKNGDEPDFVFGA